MVKALLRINQEHAILKGHFPGQPVVPGVCMMQMIKELAEHHTKKDLLLIEAENMKFLAIIDPGQNNEIEANVDLNENDGILEINASLFSGTITFFKLKATYKNFE
jgi:3-hydroxyacyl-[acyl-carrier-protein] dehydratase